jgi:hypothetical protein
VHGEIGLATPNETGASEQSQSDYEKQHADELHDDLPDCAAGASMLVSAVLRKFLRL